MSAPECATIEDALADIAAGRMIVVDDEEREKEGHLVMAAEHVTPADINFMTRHAGGWICLALTPERCDQLGLRLMTGDRPQASQPPFTVTLEAREGVTTGISVHDQAHSMRVAIDPRSGPEDIVIGGHVQALRARAGGVLERAGLTEASIDLARLAGRTAAGVICEIQNDDGSMARSDDLMAYCARHRIKMITLADLIAYRRRHEPLVERVVATSMPTSFGDFTAVGYRSLLDDAHHVALVKGDVADRLDPLVRVHSECLTGDVFGSLRCDCGQQLASALAMIEREGAGVVLYLAQEGRGIGLLNKLRAYKLQEAGFDTVDANLELGLPVDPREYGIGAQILADLGLRSIRLITNNPKKIRGLADYGIRIAERIPAVPTPNLHNATYLRTKARRMGHALQITYTSGDEAQVSAGRAVA